MPTKNTSPKWDCNRVADLLTELMDVCNRYGLDLEDVLDGFQDHIGNCDACLGKVEKFENEFPVH